MTYGSKVLYFNKVKRKTTKGTLFCTQFKHDGVAVTGAYAELVNSMGIDNAHQLKGCTSEEARN